MNRKLYILTKLLFAVFFGHAQTWTGSTSDDWYVPANWDNNSVPGANTTAIIPAAGTVTNWPKLIADIEVGGLTMGEGSQLDVNGYSITLNTTGLNLIGGPGTPITISNSNANTDIYIIGDAGSWQVGNAVFNDNITYQINGNVSFSDGFSTAATVYNGNVTYNMSSTNDIITCLSFPNVYRGNVTLSRTRGDATALTNLFAKGNAGIAGNLTVTNNMGGTVSINGTGNFFTIQGMITIDVSSNGSGNSNDFYMLSVINNTAGGHINLTNPNHFALAINTLKADVNFNNMEYLQSDNLNRIGDNNITGNFTLTNTTGTHVPVYSGGNTFTGTTSFNVAGGQLFTGYSGFGADIFNGNTTYTLGAGETLNESHGYPNKYNGNLSVTRTGAAAYDNINLFMSGHAGISGNFSFTNLHGYFGEDYINENNSPTSPIQGTINIDVNLGAAGIVQVFQMNGMLNNTAGGTINIANQSDVRLQNNTLKADMNITSLRSNSNPITINGNIITGNFLLNNFDGVQVQTGGNQFNGTTSFTVSNGRLFTGYSGLGADTYNGNTSITIGGEAELYESGGYGNQYNGNLTVTRTGINLSGSNATILFDAGHVAISGNFTFSNPHGGYTDLNNNGSASALIQGTVNVDVSNALEFRMREVRNNTAGGSITINNCSSINMSKDTLQADVTITDISETSADVFANNIITGNLAFSDKNDNSGDITIGGNTINGNAAYTSNANNLFTIGGGNYGLETYNGNFTFNMPVFTNLKIGVTDDVLFNGDVTINNGVYGFTLNDGPQKMIFSGNAASNFQQTGAGLIYITAMEMNKTGGAVLTLNSPLYIGGSGSGNLTFTNGIINSSETNYVAFLDNAGFTNAGVNSHVNGTVRKYSDDAFTFPIGTATSYNPVAMTAPANDIFSAAYISGNPYDPSSHAPTVASVSNCEHWDVNRIFGSSDVALTFTYDEPCAGPGYITNPANVHIVHWNGSSWDDLGNGGYTGTLTGTVTTAGAVNSFSPFTLAFTGIALPLNLLSLTGQQTGSGVSLNWLTADEKNVSHFDIERSSDGVLFAKIGTVNALSVRSANSYTYFDSAPQSGINFYRLKMIDVDGHFEFSKIVNVRFSNTQAVRIYPIPASSTITLQFAESFKQLEIVDINGKTLLRKNIISQSETINISALAKGIYFIRMNNGKTIISEKFVKD